MARAKSKNQTVKVHPSISLQMAEFLEQLVEIGSYGNSRSEVARYLIQRSLDDLLREGVLDKPSKKD